MSKKFYAVLIVAVFALLVSVYTALGDGLLHVNILDIGQGDSILVRTPHGQNILIDGGPDNTVAECLGDELPFWDYKIDFLILTHADADHLNGLITVLRRYQVGAVLTSAQFSTTPAYQIFLDEIQTQKIPLTVLDYEDDFWLEENLKWDTLYPFDQTFDDDTDLNNQSVVARLSYGETSFLLTGDAETDTEEDIFFHGAMLESTVLKISHHGAGTGSSKFFLDQVDPQFAVISVGKNNRYNHPNPEVIQTLDELEIPILRTDISGSLHFISDGQNVKYLQ